MTATEELVREVRAMRTQLSAIERKLAVDTAVIQADAKAVEPLGVRQFAEAIGRSPDWVYDMIGARVVKTIPGGRPHKIPRSEVIRFTTAK